VFEVARLKETKFLFIFALEAWQTSLTLSKMKIAAGLEASGHQFNWVVIRNKKRSRRQGRLFT